MPCSLWKKKEPLPPFPKPITLTCDVGSREGWSPVNVHYMDHGTSMHHWQLGRKTEGTRGWESGPAISRAPACTEELCSSNPASYKRICWGRWSTRTQRFALSELVWWTKSNYRKRRPLWQGLFHVPVTDMVGIQIQGGGDESKRELWGENEHEPAMLLGKKGSWKWVQFSLHPSSVHLGTPMLLPTAPPI